MLVQVYNPCGNSSFTATAASTVAYSYGGGFAGNGRLYLPDPNNQRVRIYDCEAGVAPTPPCSR